FRLFVKRNQASDDILFLKLFDFLDKHQEYDELKILKKLPDIKKRQLSNLKAHLYKQLLISLRLLNKNHNVNVEIREAIDYARVLYNKGLYKQSLDILSKTKSKALHADRGLLALEIISFEKHIESQYITRSIAERVDELTNESGNLFAASLRKDRLSSLSLRLYSQYLKRGYVRNEEDFKAAQQFFYEQLPDYNLQELGFLEKIYWYQAHLWYYHMTQNFAFSYRNAQQLITTFHARPEMIRIELPLYLKSLHHLLNTLFHVQNYGRFVATLGLLEDAGEQYKVNQIRNVEGLYAMYLYIHRINKHYMEGTFSEGETLVMELNEHIEKDTYNWDERREMVFNYKIACMYFGAGKYSEALDYLNLIINQRNPDYRQDIQSFARILSLISHYELGNQRLVEYQIKSVYRFLAKMKDLHDVQREIFRFLRRTPRIHTSQIRDEFIVLKSKLEEAYLKPYERRPFLYFDIISWLESKIDGRSVQEIIHEKFVRNEA
ncbi:MAG: hypothetical protein AAF738_10145, partial [Bacteroidota bacterium]